MGHSRLGTLPDTSRWRKLVALLAGGANVGAVADATMHAAETGLKLADGDEGMKHTFYLLSQVALASREENFSAALKDAGINVGAEPSVLSLVGSFTSAIDDHLRQTRGRTDVGEMAQMAAAETLTALLRDRSKTLFGTTEADIKDAVRAHSSKTGFATLAHDFFSRFTQRYLAYHLSRELPNHVGEGKRFKSPAEHGQFIDRLKAHSRQAAVIVHEFAGGWYSKTNFEGGITPRKAQGFVHVALKKLQRELKLRGERDG